MKKYILPYKWELVVLLWCAFFFNQADRQVFNVVLPLIQNDLKLSYAQMGLVASILTLVYGCFVPIAGVVGDRYNKKSIIVISLLIWSCATLFTGISTTLIELILLRSIATGGGEAFYAPSANTLISDYHEKTKAVALSIHQTSLYVGIIFSGYIAGYIADLYGWRKSFFIFGGFGIFLALILFIRLRNSPSGNVVALPIGKRKTIKETILLFFKNPTAILLTIAFAGMQFVGVGFITWMPTFLHKKFNFSLARSGFDATFYHHIAAFAGVLAGAWLGDALSKKYVRARPVIQMAGLFLGAPFIYIMSKSNSYLIIYTALTLFGFCRGIYDSNLFASLYDVVEIPYRSAATGIMLMFAFIVGSTSPYIIGVLEPSLGLSDGLAFLSLIYIFSAICILIAILFYYAKDYIPGSARIS
jgi:sugar phosphate permease